MTYISSPTTLTHRELELIMHYIYPIDETVAGLKLSIEEYYFALGHTPPEISTQSLREIVFAVIDDAVNSRLAWCEHSPQLDATIAKTFDAYSGDESDQISAQFYMHALEGDITSLTDWVSAIVPRNTWSVWFVNSVAGAIHLERGRDYRIVEFERLVRDKEIRVNKTIKKYLSVK